MAEALLSGDPVEEAPDDKTALRDAHKEAMERYDRALDADKENLTDGYEDLRFLAGDQWPDDAKRERTDEGRPILTINRLPQFVKQITGDIRMSKPAIKAVGVDDVSDPETARVISGLIRHIETSSDAQAAYFRAVDSQVTGGIGHWRVVSDWSDQDSFNHDLKIVGVRDGLGVLWDPDAVEPTREDAMFCFVPSEWTRAAFKAKFKGASEDQMDGALADEPFGWFGKDQIRLAEYWVKKPITRKLALLQSGETVDLTGENIVPFDVVKIEERPGFKVCRYLMSGHEFLEGPEDWPGRYIPIIPVLGEEINLERKTMRYGAIRFAKDPQRLYNFWRTAQTEQVALQPKAPFIGTEENFKKYQAAWSQANRKTRPFLPYTPDATNGGRPPERSSPPIASTGITEGVMLAADDMKAATGIYDAGLGNRSNETSGKAIMARQREGDIGSFVYFDNFSRAARYTGEILIDLIPHFYDTERQIRILGDDGSEEYAKINSVAIGPDGLPAVMHDVTVGKYDVVVETGPSFTTKREEAREGMQAFMQAVPQASPLFLDLYAKSMDWPFADEIAKRLEKVMPSNQQPDPNAGKKEAAEIAKTEAETQETRVDAFKGKVEAFKTIQELNAVATGQWLPEWSSGQMTQQRPPNPPSEAGFSFP